MGNSASSGNPLQAVKNCETAKFMGTWFVIGVKPTAVETKNSNAVERYTWLENKKHDIDIDFQFNKGEPITSKLSSLPQKGWVDNDDKTNSGRWKVSPVWPLKLPYLIIDVDVQDYKYAVIGYPSRAYAWLLYRHPQMPQDLYDRLTKELVEVHGYNLDGWRKVPQKWTAAEREKRGLSAEDIPDSMLEK